MPLVGGQDGIKPIRMGFQLTLFQPGEQIMLKVEIILEQKKVASLSPSKICENLNF